MSDQSQGIPPQVQAVLDKVPPAGFGTTGTAAGADMAMQRKQEAINALVALGYTVEQAGQIVDQAQTSGAGTSTSTPGAAPGITFDPGAGVTPGQKQQLSPGDPGYVQHQNYLAMVSEMTTAYLSMWGVPPPPGYVANAIANGENVVEFTYNERQKPAYSKTKEYVDRAAELAQMLATQGLGLR